LQLSGHSSPTSDVQLFTHTIHIQIEHGFRMIERVERMGHIVTGTYQSLLTYKVLPLYITTKTLAVLAAEQIMGG
jgi:hypothetical protein